MGSESRPSVSSRRDETLGRDSDPIRSVLTQRACCGVKRRSTPSAFRRCQSWPCRDGGHQFRRASRVFIGKNATLCLLRPAQGLLACCATDSCSPLENAFRSPTRRAIDGHCQEEGRRQEERWEEGRREEERREEGRREEGPSEKGEACAESGVHESDDAV